MTVAEFLAMPGDTSHLELHHGVVVDMGRLHARLRELQNRLWRLLHALGRPAMEVVMEAPFRALPEHEIRDADVAVMRAERWEQALVDGAVSGAPELVAEILSPSNSMTDMLDRERLCLANGCVEFWVLDPNANEVRVTTGDGVGIYRSGRQIPVLVFGGETIDVDAIFGPGALA